MNRYDQDLKKLKKKLYYCKDPDILQRARMLEYVMEAKNVKVGCVLLGIRRRYFYFWFNRWKKSNYDLNSLKGRSKKPKVSPNETKKEIIDLAEKIRSNYGYGGNKVAYLLERDHNIKISGTTICNHFKKRGISRVYKKIKKNAHEKRYSCENPLDRVQTDTAWSGIVDNNGNRLYFIPVIDDCTRTVSTYVSDSKCSYEAARAINKFLDKYGLPKVVQTDNGVEFTNKYISDYNPKRRKENKLSAFEEILSQHKIRHYLIRPRTPQLNGKIERFNQIIKRETSHLLKNGLNIIKVRKIVKRFDHYYNNFRPHCSLNYLTPKQKWDSFKKYENI